MRTYAVTSGKGGVGKTNLTANLAIAMADRGQRVVAFDADIGLANLDVILGARAPFKLQHVVSREKRLLEILTPGPGGIRFIAGGSGIESLVMLDGSAGDQFLNELGTLESQTDVLIFDTAAGIDENVMTFLSASDEVLLVATPDPASLADAYATAKALVMRKPGATIKVLMNQVDDEAHARSVYAKLTSIAQQFLGRPLGYAGFVRLDLRAVHCIRQRTPFILAEPSCAASQDVKRLAASLLGEPKAVVEFSLAERFRNLFGGRLVRKTA